MYSNSTYYTARPESYVFFRFFFDSVPQDTFCSANTGPKNTYQYFFCIRMRGGRQSDTFYLQQKSLIPVIFLLKMTGTTRVLRSTPQYLPGQVETVYIVLRLLLAYASQGFKALVSVTTRGRVGRASCYDPGDLIRCQNPSRNLIRKDFQTTVPVVTLH